VASEIDQQRTSPPVAEPAVGAHRAERLRRPSRLAGRVAARAHPWALVELFVLSGFAIAQPLLDVVGKSPDFFLFHRADRVDIVLLVVGVTVLPALGIWAGEVLVGLVSEPLRRLVHLTAVTMLLTLLALEVVKKLTPMRGRRLVVLAAAVGLLAGALYARQAWLRLWLRYLAPAPLVFALLFVLVSPTAKLVLPARAEPSGGGAAAVAPGAARPPVVLIFFDEFPLASLLDSKGRVDRRVYPNFAEFAERSTWYRNATGVSGFTPTAMPAMLTGRYPSKMKAPIWYEYPDNLFTLLGGSYDLKVYETISQLCPPSRCPAAAAGGERASLPGVLRDSARTFKDIISPYDAAVDPASFADQVAAAQQGTADGKPLGPRFRFDQLWLNQPSRFTDFLNGIKGDQAPTVHFLHLLLPHSPWRYLPSGVEYNTKTFGRAFQVDQTPAPIRELSHERLMLQLAYTDKLVGQVIDHLKAQGLYDKALVVLTADHGAGWTPGEKPRRLGPRNAPQLMWVPAFVKAPRQDQGRVDDRNFEQVDLLPTVADLLGVRVPWRMDGLSQTGPPARQRGDKWWFDIPGRRQVRDGPSNFSIVLQGETDSLVRASEGVRGLYRFGAFADLVYRDPATVGPIGGAAASAKLDDWKRYRRIDPGSGQVPALVSGKLTSPLPPAGSTVLVAVNGRIAGESKLFPDRPGEAAASFAVIAPDFLFKAGDGRRQLQVYQVDRSSGSPRLQPVALSG
jgi:Sulfatase